MKEEKAYDIMDTIEEHLEGNDQNENKENKKDTDKDKPDEAGKKKKPRKLFDLDNE